VLQCNEVPKCVYNGQIPRHNGFVLTPGKAAKLIEADSPANRKVVHPFLIGRAMLTDGTPDRWVIDFQKMDMPSAQRFRAPFEHVKGSVLPHVQRLAAKERQRSGKDTGQDQGWLGTWWQHFRCRKEFVDAVSSKRRYMACAEVTKRPIFCFIDVDIRPDHALQAFAFDDDYSFGIVQSDIHWRWFVAKCSKLKSDYRYTPQSVFDTFPWPQAPTKAQVRAVASASREVRRLRAEILPTMEGGLRALYRSLELPGKHPLKDAHTALDEAVRAAYGFKRGDVLAQLLALNLRVARALGKGEPVTSPGVPAPFGDPAELITDDCIGV